MKKSQVRCECTFSLGISRIFSISQRVTTWVYRKCSLCKWCLLRLYHQSIKDVIQLKDSLHYENSQSYSHLFPRLRYPHHTHYSPCQLTYPVAEICFINQCHVYPNWFSCHTHPPFYSLNISKYFTYYFPSSSLFVYIYTYFYNIHLLNIKLEIVLSALSFMLENQTVSLFSFKTTLNYSYQK